jgi:hypothetical protein
MRPQRARQGDKVRRGQQVFLLVPLSSSPCPILDIWRKTTARSNVYVLMKTQDSGLGKAHQKPEIIPQIGRRIVDCEIHTSKINSQSQIRNQNS